MSATPADVAKWMFAQLQQQKYLYQETVVYDIEKKFGADFVYDNQNGNPAIARGVLAEFRKLTKDSVVWERAERCWRLRDKLDSKGRSQD